MIFENKPELQPSEVYNRLNSTEIAATIYDKVQIKIT